MVVHLLPNITQQAICNPTQNYARDIGAIWLSIISSAPGTQGFVSSAEANDLTSSRNAIPTHVLFDSDGTVGRTYDAKTTPHMFIIDENGRLKYQGAIDDAGGRGFYEQRSSRSQ